MEIDTEEKKVERKRKNREAAKQFRERQKNLQADLELEVEQLETESASMTSHISQLEAENTLLHVLLKDMREQIVAQGTQSPGNLQNTDLKYSLGHPISAEGISNIHSGGGSVLPPDPGVD